MFASEWHLSYPHPKCGIPAVLWHLTLSSMRGMLTEVKEARFVSSPNAPPSSHQKPIGGSRQRFWNEFETTTPSETNCPELRPSVFLGFPLFFLGYPLFFIGFPCLFLCFPRFPRFSYVSFVFLGFPMTTT